MDRQATKYYIYCYNRTFHFSFSLFEGKHIEIAFSYYFYTINVQLSYRNAYRLKPLCLRWEASASCLWRGC